MELRSYQAHALKALDEYWTAGGGHPLVAMATGTGKSVLIAKLIADIAAHFPALRALVLVHVRELLMQNLEHLLRAWAGAPYGINSAGLRRRDWQAPIVLANIQSVWRAPQRLGRRDLVVIDEARLVPHEADGMYRSLIDGLRQLELTMRVCGFTATPYRLDSGRRSSMKSYSTMASPRASAMATWRHFRRRRLRPISTSLASRCAAANSFPARWKTPLTTPPSSMPPSTRSLSAAVIVARGCCFAAVFATPNTLARRCASAALPPRW
jgi:hypothetical protein